MNDDGKHLWTGLLSAQLDDDARRIAGTVGAKSPTGASGEVVVTLHKGNTKLTDDGGHVALHLSEASAAALAEALMQTVHRIEHLRALHRRGALADAALYPDDPDEGSQ